MFEIGNEVIIKDNLKKELSRLGFDDYYAEEVSNKYAGTKQKILAIWNDENLKQQYATIELCVEIPVQCLELIKKHKTIHSSEKRDRNER